eukprot:1249138-Amphidinium_carterae.2
MDELPEKRTESERDAERHGGGGLRGPRVSASATCLASTRVFRELGVAAWALEVLSDRVTPPANVEHELRRFHVYDARHEQQGDIFACVVCGSYAHVATRLLHCACRAVDGRLSLGLRQRGVAF